MKSDAQAAAPIGVFDSGVGGLSVVRELRRQMPEESIIYFGDQGHVPYGPRPLLQVREFAVEITRYLLARRAKIIVVACNSASAAALVYLREIHPNLPFVGMEPAVKPAAEQTLSGVVGVLATPATFQGELYASVVERFGAGVELLKSTCPGLVQQIERGDLEGPETRAILEAALQPMLRRRIDTIVLACTHFPFVIPLIQQIAGPEVRVIDPAPAVARQAGRLLEGRGLRLSPGAAGRSEFLTSGDAGAFRRIIRTLLGEVAAVGTLAWEDDRQLMVAPEPAS